MVDHTKDKKPEHTLSKDLSDQINKDPEYILKNLDVYNNLSKTDKREALEQSEHAFLQKDLSTFDANDYGSNAQFGRLMGGPGYMSDNERKEFNDLMQITKKKFQLEGMEFVPGDTDAVLQTTRLGQVQEHNASGSGHIYKVTPEQYEMIQQMKKQNPDFRMTDMLASELQSPKASPTNKSVEPSLPSKGKIERFS